MREVVRCQCRTNPPGDSSCAKASALKSAHHLAATTADRLAFMYPREAETGLTTATEPSSPLTSPTYSSGAAVIRWWVFLPFLPPSLASEITLAGSHPVPSAHWLPRRLVPLG
ncbi:unnamed protein product [Protopolystoma xenopodis]|uniref:Uncharacterized protein n=1 Tax=Protopolystoma xenopodis TaxID=117903 RepID=A0A3S5AUJ9_9PLAT|nr:unnamed protein product [Protopolystoma xenopodis]